MKKNKSKSYNKYIGLIIILIVLIIFFGIYKLMNNNDNPILDNSKDIVYTYYSNNENQIVPAVNIKKISDGINSNINEFVNNYLDREYISIDYHYNISGNILSLLIIVADYSREGAPDYTFKSFVINLKELEVLEDKDILELFNTNKDNIVSILDKQFNEYYNDEINNGIIDKNITYDNYLLSHEINNFYDQITFDIVNSKLEIYLDFNEFAEIETDYYFKDIGHVFSYE